MSRPGEKFTLSTGCGNDSAFFIRVVAETLLDHEVTFAVHGAQDSKVTADAITRWTHARETLIENADFLIVDGAHSEGHIRALKHGTAEMPDLGATVIYLLPAEASRETSADVVIQGPGIRPPGTTTLREIGLAADEWQAIREVNHEYPLGIDCFLILSEGSVIGLPRSVRIKEVAPWPT
jgi:phosphonate C-P lyase system protein PhnH